MMVSQVKKEIVELLRWEPLAKAEEGKSSVKQVAQETIHGFARVDSVEIAQAPPMPVTRALPETMGPPCP